MSFRSYESRSNSPEPYSEYYLQQRPSRDYSQSIQPTQSFEEIKNYNDNTIRYDRQDNIYLKQLSKEDDYIYHMNLFERRTGLIVSQKSGQKIVSNPKWQGPPPEKWSEVYFRVSRFKYEYDYVPILMTFGEIYEVRVTVDFGGTNKGYGFVKYRNPEMAKKAVSKFTPEIGKDIVLEMKVSDDNNRLFVRGIPCHLSEQDIFSYFAATTDALQKVEIVESISKNPNSGWCFLYYENHTSAACARRELMNDTHIQPWRVQISIEWSIPEPNMDEPMDTIFLKNLPLLITQKKLAEELSVHLDNAIMQRIKSIKIVPSQRESKKYSQAFITFEFIKDADIALHFLDGISLETQVVRATWARPIKKSKERDALMKDFESFNARLKRPPFVGPYSISQVRNQQSLDRSTATFSVPPPNFESPPQKHNLNGISRATNFNVNVNHSSKPAESIHMNPLAKAFFRQPNVTISNSLAECPPPSPVLFNYPRWSDGSSMHGQLNSTIPPVSPGFFSGALSSPGFMTGMSTFSPSYLLPSGIDSVPPTPSYSFSTTYNHGVPRNPCYSSTNGQYFKF